MASDEWKAAFPGAVAGVLVVSGVRNPEKSAVLEGRKRELEQVLRAQSARGIASDPRVRAYLHYYGAHGKTYHVKAQWESVAVKDKPFPSRAALVEAMFMAELKNLILTAGHDLASLALPVRVEVTREGDSYILMNGSERVLGTGDMMMVDGESIISSVLYGPDRRTRITQKTREALFAVYAPAGIGEDAIRHHLEDLRGNVLLVSPEAETGLLSTLPASAAQPGRR